MWRIWMQTNVFVFWAVVKGKDKNKEGASKSEQSV